MSWPLALATIGGAVLGGVFGKDANEENRATSEAFAQHGIRWRVADAKAAGLHPLYALGGSAPSFAPAQPVMTAAEGAAMGQRVGQAFMEDEQAALIRAQRKLTEMQTLQLASDIKLQEQRAAAQPPVAQAFPVLAPGAPQGRNLGEINPDGSWMLPQPTPLSDNWRATPSYLTSNQASPGFTPYSFPGGVELILPSKDMAEGFESIENLINQGIVLTANLEHWDRIGATQRVRAQAMRHLQRWIDDFRRNYRRQLGR